MRNAVLAVVAMLSAEDVWYVGARPLTEEARAVRCGAVRWVEGCAHARPSTLKMI